MVPTIKGGFLSHSPAAREGEGRPVSADVCEKIGRKGGKWPIVPHCAVVLWRLRCSCAMPRSCRPCHQPQALHILPMLPPKTRPPTAAGPALARLVAVLAVGVLQVGLGDLLDALRLLPGGGVFPNVYPLGRRPGRAVGVAVGVGVGSGRRRRRQAAAAAGRHVPGECRKQGSAAPTCSKALWRECHAPGLLLGMRRLPRSWAAQRGGPPGPGAHPGGACTLGLSRQPALTT